jgi:hypothetical protein
MKSKIKKRNYLILKLMVVPILLTMLTGCADSGQPSPGPTKTIYLPAPSQNNGNLGSYDEGDLQEQLDSAKQSACDSAEEIQRQWIQLNGQVIEMEMNRFGGNSGSLNLDLDAQIAQLRNQVFQLQRQEQSLRQLCNS